MIRGAAPFKTSRRHKAMPSKAQMQTALVALAAFAIVAYVQRNVVAIPIVGEFLPQ